MKANVKNVCRINVRSLKLTKLACSEHKQLRNDFDASVVKSLGPVVTISEFDYK